MRRTYSFHTEPAGPCYKGLIAESLVHAQTLLLVKRPQMKLDPSAADLLAKLKPFIIEETDASAWPGTVLINNAATIYTVHFRPTVAEIMTEAAIALYAWIHPELPEDPCLLRADGTPWLVTIAHENDAYMELNDDELAELASKVPGLDLAPDVKNQR